MVFTRSTMGSGHHTVEIRALGTPGHPRVDIDALVTMTPVAGTTPSSSSPPPPGPIADSDALARPIADPDAHPDTGAIRSQSGPGRRGRHCVLRPDRGHGDREAGGGDRRAPSSPPATKPTRAVRRPSSRTATTRPGAVPRPDQSRAGQPRVRDRGGGGLLQLLRLAGRDAGAGWYAFDLGTWRIYVAQLQLRASSAATPGSAQEQWLRADLAANLAPACSPFWHHPRFSSGPARQRHGGAALWDDLYAAGADVIAQRP